MSRIGSKYLIAKILANNRDYTISINLTISLFLLMLSYDTSAIEDNKALHEWYNHYYLHQDNKLLVPALKYFYSAKYPATELKKMAKLGFFSKLFKQHPQQAVRWIKQSSLSSNERKPLLLALSLAGLTKQAIDRAKKDHWTDNEIAELNQPKVSLTPANLVINQDVNIGFLWGAFKASGNKQYLDIIINTLFQSLGSVSKITSESIIATAVKTLHYHRSIDTIIDEHYVTRYNGLDPIIQEEIDILFAAHEGDDGSLDCD